MALLQFFWFMIVPIVNFQIAFLVKTFFTEFALKVLFPLMNGFSVHFQTVFHVKTHIAQFTFPWLFLLMNTIIVNFQIDFSEESLAT